jgi:hypothetical protein
MTPLTALRGTEKETTMKKIYNRPRLTVHGGATQQTQGRRLGDEYDLRDGLRWSW